MKTIEQRSEIWTVVRRLEDEIQATTKHMSAIRYRATERDREGEDDFDDANVEALHGALQMAKALEQKLLGLRLSMQATEDGD